jgi:hypothetical protein
MLYLLISNGNLVGLFPSQDDAEWHALLHALYRVSIMEIPL